MFVAVDVLIPLELFWQFCDTVVTVPPLPALTEGYNRNRVLHNVSVVFCKGGVTNSGRAERNHLHPVCPVGGSSNLVRKKRRERRAKAVAGNE